MSMTKKQKIRLSYSVMLQNFKFIYNIISLICFVFIWFRACNMVSEKKVRRSDKRRKWSKKDDDEREESKKEVKRVIGNEKEARKMMMNESK